MTADDGRELLDYHYWARDRMLDAVALLDPAQFLRDLGSSFRSVRDTCVHICSAEWVWYSRWVGVSPSAHLPADAFPDVASLRSRWIALEEQVRTFAAALAGDDLTRVIDYRTLNGAPDRTALGPMIRHVVNHASYHRGQVTTMLRQMGAAAPGSMDLIAFVRTRT
jgi:uncharacterized damage-inducible protein DinB